MFDFDGTVGSYPVTGSFDLGTTGELFGQYGYKKNGKKPKAYLSLEGNWDGNSSTVFKLYFYEYSNGKVTGTWNLTYDRKKRTLTGTMTTNGKTYKVNARVRNQYVIN